MQENVAVLFISGQSNAHAHGQLLKESDYIVNPLKNVFSLDRDPNQSFVITDVVWSGFTTQGKNLGETQDNTYSFAYFFAKLWQNAIDCGAMNLPDLYIVQVSVGSQGKDYDTGAVRYGGYIIVSLGNADKPSCHEKLKAEW